MQTRLPASLVGVALCLFAVAVSAQARSAVSVGSPRGAAGLTLGASAPDIVGTDLDGRALRQMPHHSPENVTTTTLPR